MGTEPLVLLPGRLCDARLFRAQVAGLAGLTEISIGDITVADSFEEIARAVLAAAPPRFALAGLSFGGIVAMEIMRQAPGRVTRLALLDANPGGNTPRHLADFEEQICQATASPADFLKLTTGLFYPQMVHPARLGDTELRDEVVAMALAVGPEAFVRQNRALQKRNPRWDDLPHISCPGLVLSGREDMVCPLSIQEDMARLIPGARLEIIEDCGHLSTMEQPGKVTEILKAWLLSGA
jgi:pimeloyl-ACP methyl ester carboxylesterase